MGDIDPRKVIRSLRMLQTPDIPVLALCSLGLAEAALMTAKLQEQGPPAIGILGLDPGQHWYTMKPNPDMLATVQPGTFELEVATLRVVPSTSPRDPWVALILEASEPAPNEQEIDPEDRPLEDPDASRVVIGGTDLPQLHSGLLRRAGLSGIPALRAAGILGEQGELTLGALLCFARAVEPPVPPGWTIVVERYDTDPGTVERLGLEAVETRALEPPLPFAIDAIVDELSVEQPFLHRDSRFATVALREILVNAIVHRLYTGLEEEPVKVICHPDRVIVDSPGAWAEPENETDETDETDETASHNSANIPNPNLHALMARLGLCQQQGMGLERARLHARAIGMRLELERWDDGVWASLIVDRQLSLEMGAPGSRRESTTRKPASVREDRMLEYLRQRDSASKREIAEALELPEPTVAVTLKKLRDKGWVAPTERAARSPRQRYRLVKPRA